MDWHARAFGLLCGASQLGSMETVSHLRALAIHEMTHLIYSSCLDWDRLDWWIRIEEEREAANFRDRVLASIDLKRKDLDRAAASDGHVDFAANPAEPLFLSHGGFWSWLSSRLEKCARGGATPLSILRQQIGLLDALIRVAFQIVNSPWLLIQVLLAERPFFEYHGLGRPPRCLTAQTWTGLPQRNLRGMHSTRFVPA